MPLQKFPMTKHTGDWGSIPRRHCYITTLSVPATDRLLGQWVAWLHPVQPFSYSYCFICLSSSCGGPYLSLRLSIGEPSLSGSLLLSGVPMQYRSLPTVIRKLCSSEDSERRLGERLCKLKKECKPINQGVLIWATERQETLFNKQDLGWMDQLKKTNKN